ncbi:MAG: HAD-IC family P-type ATPase [Rhodothermales bacterium]|nr:HAD-IC family P-type ATPase [Rhodothermales bacterium]
MLPWHARPAEDVLKALGSDADQGLSHAEAERRRAAHGPNTLHTRPRTPWYRVLGRQFAEALVLILVAAAGVSVLVGAVVDALTILGIVLLNGVLGFVQEWKAERAIEALYQMLAPRARVRRAGHVEEVDARHLVPGDVVVVEVGDRVPADLRILDAYALRLDESALTGESVPVAKDVAPLDPETPLAACQSMAWMGTVATAGRGLGAVVATGAETAFGRIAHLTAEVEDEATPLQRKLGVLGRQLGVAAVAVSAVIAGAGWLTGRGLLEMFMTGVSLAVAVVPEGLPAVVTLTLALGVRAMVRRNVLLRRLSAAEAIGAATVICTDKTGTLTQNEMTVDRLWIASGAVDLTGVGYDPAGHFERDGRRVDYRAEPDLLALLETGLRCTHAEVYQDGTAWRAVGDPTEAALVVAAYKAWLPPEGPARVAEFAFTSARKRMTMVVRNGAETVAHVKGAPEVVLARCTSVLVGGVARPLDASLRREAEAAYQAMARAGRRTLALARRTLAPGAPLTAEAAEQDLTLLGLASLQDPPRPEVAGALRRARTAGVRVVMITGDAPETARAIGQQIGLGAGRVLTGEALAGLDDAALGEALRDDVIFARTVPEHKLRIVSLLQAQGEIVGMTGDGVNDAPALKKADVGIAMGKRGTDVAQGASDMVLTDDHFASIIAGVEEGRRQYANIRKFVRYLLTSNTGEVLAIFGNILLGGPLLLLPVQILWMNLVTDGLTAVALGVEPAERDVMRRPPHDPKAPLLSGRWLAVVAALGTYLALATLALFHYVLSQGGGVALAQTVAFTGLVVMEKANVFNFRALREPIRTVGLFSNPWLLVAVAGTLALQLAAVYVPFLQAALQTVPLGAADWVLIGLVSLPVFAVPEVIKMLGAWKRRRSKLA